MIYRVVENLHSSRLRNLHGSEILRSQHLLRFFHRCWEWLRWKRVNVLLVSLAKQGLRVSLRVNLTSDYLLTSACPFLWKRRCSVGRLVGLVARLVRPLMSTGFARFWCCDRSIMIFLQMSRSVLAIVRAGMSQRNTWHMCFRVDRSLATYAKSLKEERHDKQLTTLDFETREIPLFGTLLTFRCFGRSLKGKTGHETDHKRIRFNRVKHFPKMLLKIDLPAVVSANAPHPHRVNRLRVEHGKILRVY